MLLEQNGLGMERLRKIDSSHFDWLHWLGGNPLDLFGVHCRTMELVENKHLLQKAAVGYCEGVSTACRPKNYHKGVMYFVKGNHFWFHLRDEEFKLIFGDHI